jgi:hypothetical protein
MSRRDNFTDICPECGTAEAMEDFAAGGAGAERWLLENPSRSRYWRTPEEVEKMRREALS